MGLKAALNALADERVETLLVSEGFRAPGGRCPTCGQLGIDGGQCSRCGTDTVEIDDVVQAAVDEAVAHRVTVEFYRDSDLDRLGHIGALTRF